MTDQTDTLRARIAELERQLAEARRLLKEAVPVIAKIRDSMATLWLERVAALAPAEKPGSDDGPDTDYDYDPSRDM